MTITIKDDFNLEKIKNSGQAFRIKKINNYYRFISKNKILYIKQIENNKYELLCNKDDFKNFWFNYFDLNRNYSEIRKTINKNDQYLLLASSFSKGIRILKQDPLEVIISFIISQRRSIPSIANSIEKLCTLYGKKVKTDFEEVFLFPSLKKLSTLQINDFSKIGVGYRDKYLVDAIHKIYYNEISLNNLSVLSDNELIATLKTINGIGDKVANCIALFGYNRVNMAPIDIWIKRVIDLKYNGVNPFLQYKSNSGILQQFLFYNIRYN